VIKGKLEQVAFLYRRVGGLRRQNYEKSSVHDWSDRIERFFYGSKPLRLN
jgi:hypothetical protein